MELITLPRDAKVINLTNNPIEVYAPEQFVGLEQVDSIFWMVRSKLWVADDVVGEPIACYPYRGECRDVPDGLDGTEVLIVSPVDKMRAKQDGLKNAPQMVSPYRDVFKRDERSVLLGWMGFTY